MKKVNKAEVRFCKQLLTRLYSQHAAKRISMGFICDGLLEHKSIKLCLLNTYSELFIVYISNKNKYSQTYASLMIYHYKDEKYYESKIDIPFCSFFLVLYLSIRTGNKITFRNEIRALAYRMAVK